MPILEQCVEKYKRTKNIEMEIILCEIKKTYCENVCFHCENQNESSFHGLCKNKKRCINNKIMHYYVFLSFLFSLFNTFLSHTWCELWTNTQDFICFQNRYLKCIFSSIKKILFPSFLVWCSDVWMWICISIFLVFFAVSLWISEKW